MVCFYEINQNPPSSRLRRARQKNMDNNKKLPIVSIIFVFVAVLALGYFLFKSSPKDLSPISSQNSDNPSNASNVDNMHNQPNVPESDRQFNSLLGNPLPEIQLTDKDGEVYTAPDFKGKNTVLFFNEGLMCYPACWNQMASFGSDARYNSDQVQAISVVVDSAKDWQRAIDKMPELAKATTMFDAGANASRRLGILTPRSSMHRGTLPGHTYILLDKDAVIRFVFDDPNMAIANDMLWGKIQKLNGN